MSNNSENFPYNDWRSSFEDHPQFSVLKNHIDRAVQDLFLGALRTQGEEFIYIFDCEQKIDDFASRMIKYWEVEENYELQEKHHLDPSFPNFRLEFQDAY